MLRKRCDNTPNIKIRKRLFSKEFLVFVAYFAHFPGFWAFFLRFLCERYVNKCFNACFFLPEQIKTNKITHRHCVNWIELNFVHFSDHNPYTWAIFRVIITIERFVCLIRTYFMYRKKILHWLCLELFYGDYSKSPRRFDNIASVWNYCRWLRFMILSDIFELKQNKSNTKKKWLN